MSEVPAADLKSHVKITTTTTTVIMTAIITAITLMLANWLSSVSATTTNPDYTFPRLCFQYSRSSALR